MEIRTVTREEDLVICKNIILAFSKNVKEENFLKEMINLIRNESLYILYMYDEQCNKVAAFMNYRYMRTLRSGLIISVDDLCTAPGYRGKECGSVLMEYVKKKAIACGINSVHLDSGIPLHLAQCFYLNNGYDLERHHFTMAISWTNPEMRPKNKGE